MVKIFSDKNFIWHQSPSFLLINNNRNIIKNWPIKKGQVKSIIYTLLRTMGFI
jgi:hypothetical protein